MGVSMDFTDLLDNYAVVLADAGATDIEKMAYRLCDRGFLAEPHRDVTQHLTACVKRLLKEDAITPFDIPSEIPRNNRELYLRYNSFVRKTLFRKMTWGLDHGEADAEHDVWAELFHSNVIVKYMQRAIFKRLPSTMTLSEALDYLGIHFDQWESLGSLAPTPVSGHWLDDTALFKTEDIRNLDRVDETERLFTKRPMPRKLPLSTRSARKFVAYLRTAIYNKIKNLFRRATRRFNKDTPMSNPHVYLSERGSGYQVTALDSEGEHTWETCLTSKATGIESICEAHLMAEKMGALADDGSYVNSLKYMEDLSELLKVARRSGFEVGSDDARIFIQTLSQGHTRAEALRRIQTIKRRVFHYTA